MREIEERAADGISISVRVKPRASRTKFAGRDEQGIRLDIKAPPVEGAANKECIRFLAKTFGVTKNAVTLIRGQKNKNKVFEIQGISLEKAVVILRNII